MAAWCGSHSRRDRCISLDAYRHPPRDLAEFCYRFDRRFDLAAMLPRLGVAAARTPPMLYRLLKLAEAHW
jgi:hypothetical protein